jgi:C4-dicarboxylate-binding protein DctP
MDACAFTNSCFGLRRRRVLTRRARAGTLRLQAARDLSRKAASGRISMLKFALAGVIAVAMMGSALAQSPIVIKFSHVVANDTPKGKGADKFKELAEKYTSGKVKVEVYPNSQLYKDKEEVEALQLGAVQMLAPSLAKFGSLGAKEFETFDMPFMFPDRAALRKITDGPIGKELLKKLEPKGILGLAYWDNGFKLMSANTPLRDVKDFHGRKMRIQSSKVLDAQFRALGAIPQVMAFSEVYQAMQTGVVDGSENTPSNMFTQKHYEVQKDITNSRHGYIGYAVIVNKQFWEGLPADVRGQLEKAMKEATDYANSISEQENNEALAAMKASGRTTIIDLTPQQKADWMKALDVVYKEMEDRVGKELLARMVKETRG